MVKRNVPLRLITVNNQGDAMLDSEALLTEREHFYKIDISTPYKLNAGTTGVCKSSFFIRIRYSNDC